MLFLKYNKYDPFIGACKLKDGQITTGSHWSDSDIHSQVLESAPHIDIHVSLILTIHFNISPTILEFT